MGVEVRLLGGEPLQQRALLPEGGSTAPPRHRAGAAGRRWGRSGPVAKEEGRNSLLQSGQSCCCILDQKQRRWARHRPLFLLSTPLTCVDEGRGEMTHLGNIPTFITGTRWVVPVCDIHISEVVSAGAALSEGPSCSQREEDSASATSVCSSNTSTFFLGFFAGRPGLEEPFLLVPAVSVLLRIKTNDADLDSNAGVHSQ